MKSSYLAEQEKSINEEIKLEYGEELLEKIENILETLPPNEINALVYLAQKCLFKVSSLH